MAISGTFSAGDQVSGEAFDCAVDQTPSSSSFVQIESWATDIQVAGGDTPVSNFNTFDVPIVYTGEQNPYTVTVTCVYSEAAATDVFPEIYDDYVAAPGLAYDFRWTPKGNTTGNFRFTTSGGKLVNVMHPSWTATGATPSTFQFVIACSAITRDTVPV